MANQVESDRAIRLSRKAVSAIACILVLGSAGWTLGATATRIEFVQETEGRRLVRRSVFGRSFETLEPDLGVSAKREGEATIEQSRFPRMPGLFPSADGQIEWFLESQPGAFTRRRVAIFSSPIIPAHAVAFYRSRLIQAVSHSKIQIKGLCPDRKTRFSLVGYRGLASPPNFTYRLTWQAQ